MVEGSLNIIADTEGNLTEEIVNVGAREGGEVTCGLLEGVGAGEKNLEGGGVEEEAESET